MQLILPWRAGPASYQAAFQDIEVEKPERCPHCGCNKFHKWGKYKRYVIEEDVEHIISIQRIRCVKCRRTYSYLPSFCISGICYGLDFVLRILQALLLKKELALDKIRRRGFAFLRRFVQLESLWLIFLRASGVGAVPADKRGRLRKILETLLEFHRNRNLLASFLQETGRHFLSVK